MFRNFEEIEAYLNEHQVTKRLVLAGAQDDIALSAVVRATKAGYVDPILVGDVDRITELLAGMGESAADYELVAAATENKCARTAVKMVVDGKADIPMKGLMQTATYLMSVRFGGLADPDALVNECTVFHYADVDRLIVTGDCAVNISPTLDEKKVITANLIDVARSLEANPVRVAQLSALEKAEPTMPSSMDAKELAGMDWGEDVVCEGPLALDGVLDEEAAKHKGIQSEVAGKADVIVVPDIHAGNVLHKCVHFFGHYPFASMLLGAYVPVVMNSRTDDAEAKYLSILVAIMRSLKED